MGLDGGRKAASVQPFSAQADGREASPGCRRFGTGASAVEHLARAVPATSAAGRHAGEVLQHVEIADPLLVDSTFDVTVTDAVAQADDHGEQGALLASVGLDAAGIERSIRARFPLAENP